MRGRVVGVRAAWIRGWATLVGGALVLAGCATAPPPAPVEAIAAPAAWEGAPGGEAPRVTDGVAAPAKQWWSAFDDARLDGLVESVLAENHDLGAAAARVDAALAQARIAGAGRKPSVSAGLDGSRRRQNFVGFPIPGSEGGVLSTTSTTVSTALNVSWEADLWGRLRGAAARGAAQAEAAAADLEAARLSLSGQASKAWFAVLEAEGQVELARQTLASRGRSADQVRRRYESGLRTSLDLRLALSNEATAAAALAGRERGLDAARRAVELLAARYPSTGSSSSADNGNPGGIEEPRVRGDTRDHADDVKTNGEREGEVGSMGRDEARASGALPVLPPDPSAGLPSEMVARRPDLRAAERRLEAAGLDVAIARAALYPRLTLTGSAGRLSSDLEDLVDSDFSIWSLAAGILQPVFQGGRLRAGVDLSSARQREAAHGYAQQVLRAFSEVERSLASAGFLDEIYLATTEAATQARAAERLAQERYLGGLSDYLAVLEAQRQAFDAESRLLEVERQRLDNRVDLFLALGGPVPASDPMRAATAASHDSAGAEIDTDDTKTLEDTRVER